MAVAPSYAGNAVHGGLNEVEGSTRTFAVTGTVGASDTYVTGGFAITPAQVGLSRIDWMGPITFSTGHWGIYIPASGLIKVFSAAATELANASTALQSATFFAFGHGK